MSNNYKVDSSLERIEYKISKQSVSTSKEALNKHLEQMNIKLLINKQQQNNVR